MNVRRGCPLNLDTKSFSSSSSSKINQDTKFLLVVVVVKLTPRHQEFFFYTESDIISNIHPEILFPEFVSQECWWEKRLIMNFSWIVTIISIKISKKGNAINTERNSQGNNLKHDKKQTFCTTPKSESQRTRASVLPPRVWGQHESRNSNLDLQKSPGLFEGSPQGRLDRAVQEPGGVSGCL